MNPTPEYSKRTSGNSLPPISPEMEMLRCVLDSLPDNIFVKDQRGAYVLSNLTHLKDLGVQGVSSIVGKNAFDFFPEELAQAYHQRDLEIFASGKPQLNVEEKRLNREGKERWLLTSKVPIDVPAMDFQGIVGISRDITEKKQAEERLRNLLLELQETREQLAHADKLKTLGRLAAGIAHEIKNPLAVISLGLEILAKRCAGNDGVVEVLKDMDSAVQEANTAVWELLEYARPEHPEFREEDLNHRIRQTLHFLNPSFQQNKIRVRLDLDSKPLPVSCDGRKVHQILVNLILNACQAMPEGGELSITTRSERIRGQGRKMGRVLSELFAVGDAVVQIDICDTGPGIPEAHIREVFEPFFTSREDSSGTGLGLTVVRQLVDLHHGAVNLFNRPEGGLCARLLFPLSIPQTPETS